ncbi:MAG TPA: HAMP domain-containing sensor histidine kinase [Polyangia bacterium]
MSPAVSLLKEEEPAPVLPHEALVTLPLETVARLDRMATASMLATGLAHEIANPLSCLIAALDGLGTQLERLSARGEVVEPIARELAELGAELELAGVSGNEIFAQVRDFQQFLRPRELETSAPIDLKPPILRAVRMSRTRLGSKSPVSVVLGEAPAVRIPASRITQIVLNLLLNAAAALGDRPWSQNQVEVRLATVEHWAVIEVKDNGPGIDAATRQRLFEPGVTGGKTAGRSGGPGLGLGLAICRELARAAGGEISVSSPLTGSTLFRVALPPAAAT